MWRGFDVIIYVDTEELRALSAAQTPQKLKPTKNRCPSPDDTSVVYFACLTRPNKP